MKFLKIVGGVLAALAVVAGVAWLFRTNPLGPIAGRALSGTPASYPSSWEFTDEHDTIAVEVRPEDPHSVTTICFVHQGSLYVPAQSGSSKDWTQYVLGNSQVRLKVGERIFQARALRVTDAEPSSFFASASKKYERLASQDELPEDLWLFRIAPREG
jgi:hypothetical protein